MAIDHKPISVFFCLVLLSGCAATPSTQDRTVRQGSDRVEKACTEKPSGYTEMFEDKLKVQLPLGTTSEPQAEGVLRRYIEQEPKGTSLGEDLQSYLFYICQMSNNGGFTQETTERLINIFIEKWPNKTTQAVPETERMSELTIEAVNDPISRLPQENQAQPPRVTKFSRIRVNNVGRQPIRNIKLVVLKAGGMQARFQLPIASIHNLFEFPSPPIPSLSVDLSPGDDREFEAVVECNGIVTMKCPKGNLAIFTFDNGKITFLSFIQNGAEHLDEFTVRATGEGATATTKTFRVSKNDDGLIVLKESPD